MSSTYSQLMGQKDDIDDFLERIEKTNKQVSIPIVSKLFLKIR